MSLRKLLILLTGCYAAYKFGERLSVEEKADDIVDAASEDSFPASDPPAWTGTITAPTTPTTH